MKRKGIHLAANCLLAGVLCSLSATTAFAARPRVIKAVPDDGQTDVDPALREVRVTFDQDMDRGFSWVGGGPTFPKTTGRPRWIKRRTSVLPVKLEPNRKYWLSINSNKFKNFRSTKGEAAVPYPISFTTGPGKGGESEPLTPKANKAAVEALRQAIDEEYSYRDLRDVDWDALLKRYAPRMEKATSPASFARQAVKLLAHAEDMHIWLKVGDQSFKPFKRSITRNYDMKSLSRVVPGWREESKCVYRGRFDDGIGYIMITSWSKQDRDALEPAFEALDDFLDTKALIVDVRPNSGGSEPLAAQFAGCFVDKPVVYAKHVNRQPSAPGGFTQPHNRVLDRKKGRPKYRGRVAVLMGQENMSSCEAFLLMMKQVPACKLIGERSYGSSGNPKPADLGNGVVVYLPSWKAMRPDGSLFEGEGIAPDVPVKTTRRELRRRDAVLEAALEFLRKH